MNTHAGENNHLVLFSDFDGTISRCDIGNLLFHHFSDGKSDEPVRRWRNNEIDSRACLQAESELIRDVSREELMRYFDSFDIDPGFSNFAAWSKERGIPLYVLSDGLDIYIDRVLRRHGLENIPVFTNHAEIRDNRMRIEWPYFNSSCEKCGNCKGYHIRRLRKPGQRVVYIGDGKSDLCALEHADTVFAKDFLAEYCLGHDIPYVPYTGFTDVVTALESLTKA